MKRVKPDAVIVLGDTNSCLSIIAAKRLKIPIFHMEAGNRCKDENLPEEVIRRIVDVTSDVNLCYSEHARRYILQSGVRPEYTYVVGSPMAEVLSSVLSQIEASNILRELGLEKGKYLLLSAHREENIDIEQNFFSLMNAVNEMARTYDMPILYSCHPRSEKMIEKKGFKFDERVIQHKPLGFFDYNKLQQNAFVSFPILVPYQRKVLSSIFRLFQSAPLQSVLRLWTKGSLPLVVSLLRRFVKQWNLPRLCMPMAMMHAQYLHIPMRMSLPKSSSSSRAM